MAFAKTIEMTADSSQSFDDAVRKGVDKAGSTLEQVRAVWVEDQFVEVDNGTIANYRVRLKVTFELK